jgi:hypothetical protein
MFRTASKRQENELGSTGRPATGGPATTPLEGIYLVQIRYR